MNCTVLLQKWHVPSKSSTGCRSRGVAFIVQVGRRRSVGSCVQSSQKSLGWLHEPEQQSRPVAHFSPLATQGAHALLTQRPEQHAAASVHGAPFLAHVEQVLPASSAGAVYV